MPCKDNITLSGSKAIGYQVISNNTGVAFAEIVPVEGAWCLKLYDPKRLPFKSGVIPMSLIGELFNAFIEARDKEFE